jgi:hypothetical protein
MKVLATAGVPEEYGTSFGFTQRSKYHQEYESLVRRAIRRLAIRAASFIC